MQKSYCKRNYSINALCGALPNGNTIQWALLLLIHTVHMENKNGRGRQQHARSFMSGEMLIDLP